QVNVTGDRRAGVTPDECSQFAGALERDAGLRVRGVMAIGPVDRGATREAFERAADALRSVRGVVASADTLSLGMSDDLEAAVAAGSTMVRLGTALFGARLAKG